MLESWMWWVLALVLIALLAVWGWRRNRTKPAQPPEQPGPIDRPAPALRAEPVYRAAVETHEQTADRSVERLDEPGDSFPDDAAALAARDAGAASPPVERGVVVDLDRVTAERPVEAFAADLEEGVTGPEATPLAGAEGSIAGARRADVSGDEPVAQGTEAVEAAKSAEDAEAMASAPRRAESAAMWDGPLGPGSAEADEDGSGPAGWTVKAARQTMVYLTPDIPVYEQAKANVWFIDEDRAQSAGFRRWDRPKD